jgi:2-polyprenyl-6-methoxyphenol hydroxylase-like FAD-dependent oxidoreductase
VTPSHEAVGSRSSRGADYSVVIAGGGPVGLMLACELGLAGVDVLVIERLTSIDPTMKAGYVNLATAQAFYRRGMLPQLQERHDAAVERVQKFLASKGVENAAGGGPVGAHFSGIVLDIGLVDFTSPMFTHAGPAAGVILVSQQEIEALLNERAADLGVTVLRDAEVAGFTAEGDGVTVELGDGRTVRGEWLVGADGGRSVVRKLAGFEFPGEDPAVTARQFVVDMIGHEKLPVGWNRTDGGVYLHGPYPGRLVTVELDGPPEDREAPITPAELEATVQKVAGVDVTVTAIHSATRFTDHTRQANTYRLGRVLLAGDAAHVHSPLGGQGQNLGIGDAVNLGWKLAAVVKGSAPEDLLDSYTAERHPVGEWVLEWTRAQVAAMRTDAHSSALRNVLSDLISTPNGATYVLTKLSGMLHRYEPGEHNLVGAPAPDVELADGTHVGDHCADGRALLIDLADNATVRDAADGWAGRVRVVSIKPAQQVAWSALLVRPDGYVAWAADENPDMPALSVALRQWFGEPTLRDSSTPAR